MKKGIKLYVCKILVGMSLIILCGCSCGEDDSRIASSDETSAVNSESTSMEVTVSGDVSEEDSTNLDEEASKVQGV